MKGILVIVPCGQAKIWDKYPSAGPAEARTAYTGAPFKVNKQYAECFAEHWVVLSAKYGFIQPAFLLPGLYNVTFKKKSTNPVSFAKLKEQAREQNLDKYETIIGLGGKEYRLAIEQAFGNSVNLLFPFSGLPIGKSMQAVKKAVEKGEPF